MKKRKSLQDQEGKNFKALILRSKVTLLSNQLMLKKSRLVAPTNNSLNKRKTKHWKRTWRYSFTREEHAWLGQWADVNSKVGRKCKSTVCLCADCVNETTTTKQTAGSKWVSRLNEAETVAAVKGYRSWSLSAGYQCSSLRIVGKLALVCLLMKWSRQRELCQLIKMASVTRCLRSDSSYFKTEPLKWSTSSFHPKSSADSKENQTATRMALPARKDVKKKRRKKEARRDRIIQKTTTRWGWVDKNRARN